MAALRATCWITASRAANPGSRIGCAAQRIVDYPFGRMGVCLGRGYGGAILLGFPRFFGSTAAYVLEGATVGLMQLAYPAISGGQQRSGAAGKIRYAQVRDVFFLRPGTIGRCLVWINCQPDQQGR